METPTNLDLLKRIDELEAKMDRIVLKLEQANGAWLFVKILGSVALGGAVLWNAIKDLLR